MTPGDSGVFYGAKEMTKNTTAAERHAMLAKESLVIRKSPPILLSDFENGNRSQRRIAAKQKRREKK